jgi:Ca2+-binding EF-hand superfamily protein/WD40 repeat protein
MTLPHPVYAVALSADATQMAVGSGKTVLYHITTRNEPFRLPTSGVVRSVAMSPDGSRIAAGGFDGVITVWKVRAPKRLPAAVPAPRVHRLEARIIDTQTKQPLDKARISCTGGPGTCNLLEWKSGPAAHLFETTAPGSYTFRVTCDGYPDRNVQLASGNRQLQYAVGLTRKAAPPKTTPKPTPKPGLVELRIKVQHADGSDVQGPKIRFIAGPGRETLDGEGPGGILRYKVTKPGKYRVVVSKEGYTSRTVAVRAEAGGKPQTVVLHRIFKLLLTVLDGDKQPVVKPAIEIAGPGRSELMAEARGVHTYSLTTNGQYTVTVSKKGLKEQVVTLSVRDRETRRTIEMGWGFELLLTVTDADGQPIGDPGIEISGPGKSEKVSVKDGVHTFSMTSNGVYTVLVSKPGHRSKTESIDIALGARRHTVQLETVDYKLVLRVWDAENLDVTAPAGRTATLQNPDTWGLRLPPGTYEVEVKTDDVVSKRVTIRNKDEELTLEPRLPSAAKELHDRLDVNEDLRVNQKDFPTGWKEMAKFDANRDGELQVSELAGCVKEFRQEWKKAYDEPGPDSTMDRRVQELFNALDHNGDDQVDKNDSPEGWKILQQIDTNGDGKLDKSELVVWQKEFDREWDKAYASKSGVPPAPSDEEADLDDILDSLDYDKNGRIEKKECSGDCWKELSRLDRDKNDAVSRDELRNRPKAKPPEGRKEPAPGGARGTLTIRRVGG